MAVCHFAFAIKAKNSKPLKSKPSLKISARTESFQVPSAFELAQIAIQIAQLPTEHTREFSYLARLAFEMWDECEKIRNERIAVIQAAINLNSPENVKILKREITFPISLDDFLTLMMPKKKRNERTAFYREFLRQQIRCFNHVRMYFPNGVDFKNVPQPKDEEVDKAFEIANSQSFQAFAYAKTAEAFRQWLSEYEASIRRERASKGGNVLKAKRTENNS